MNSETFDQVVTERLTKIQTVLASKNKEYSSGLDRLHNFKVAARIGRNPETPEQALLGMLKKHLVSLFDIIEDTARGGYPPPQLRDEKIGDSINYLILLEALLIERSPQAAKAPLVVEGTCGSLIYK